MHFQDLGVPVVNCLDIGKQKTNLVQKTKISSIWSRCGLGFAFLCFNLNVLNPSIKLPLEFEFGSIIVVVSFFSKSLFKLYIVGVTFR